MCCTNVRDFRQGKFVQPGLGDLNPSRRIKLEKLRLNPTFLPRRGPISREMGSHLPEGENRHGTLREFLGHSGNSFPTRRGCSGSGLPPPIPVPAAFPWISGLDRTDPRDQSGQVLAGKSQSKAGFAISWGLDEIQDLSGASIPFLPCTDFPHQVRFRTCPLNQLFVLALDSRFPHRKPPQNSQFTARISPKFSSLLDLFPPWGAERGAEPSCCPQHWGGLSCPQPC